MKSTTFLHAMDFSRKLRHYCSTEQRLTSTTLFATIDVRNCHMLASHASLTTIVGYFLQDNLATNKLENMTISNVLNLIQLVLYNNHFIYRDKVYTCLKGGPMTMKLIRTLDEIYLFEWQKVISKEVNRQREFFGR
jgi:hypothetical protein